MSQHKVGGHDGNRIVEYSCNFQSLSYTDSHSTIRDRFGLWSIFLVCWFLERFSFRTTWKFMFPKTKFWIALQSGITNSCYHIVCFVYFWKVILVFSWKIFTAQNKYQTKQLQDNFVDKGKILVQIAVLLPVWTSSKTTIQYCLLCLLLESFPCFFLTLVIFLTHLYLPYPIIFHFLWLYTRIIWQLWRNIQNNETTKHKKRKKEVRVHWNHQLLECRSNQIFIRLWPSHRFLNRKLQYHEPVTLYT